MAALGPRLHPARRFGGRWLKGGLVAAAALYGAAACYIWAVQRSLLYPRAPDTIAVATQALPRAADVSFNTRDGLVRRA